MQTFNDEQIELCKQLYGKLGIQRKPQAGEWWYFKDNACAYIYDKSNEDLFRAFSVDSDYGSDVTNISQALHPLYSCEEVLEIIKKHLSSISIIPQSDGKWFLSADIYDDNKWECFESNLLTALLKLALEVCK